MTSQPAELPFSEAYWVMPQLFLAGEYPAGYDELATRRRMQGLIKAGCSSFIDLTHPDDYMPGYESILQDEANGYLKRVTYDRFPIADRSIPSSEKMRQILDHIDGAIEQKKSVYLHCIAGVGRTGTVVGCYLVRHGVPADEVMARIKLLRMGVPSRWARSPEADEQVNFILAWKSGQ